MTFRLTGTGFEDLPVNNLSASGSVSLPSTTSIGNVSSIELGYLDNVTSAIQTQLNAKAPSASPTFTGQIGTPSGTASAPSISPSGDTNTGLFFPAADTLAFSSNGTERMRIDSSGRTTRPFQPSFYAYGSGSLSISGASTFYCGGGGGGGRGTSSGGAGGSSIGGSGGTENNGNGGNGVANTGSGGGGCGASAIAGNGGSGIVIIRYPLLDTLYD
jgi:hypothetical protein